MSDLVIEHAVMGMVFSARIPVLALEALLADSTRGCEGEAAECLVPLACLAARPALVQAADQFERSLLTAYCDLLEQRVKELRPDIFGPAPESIEERAA